MNPVFNPLWFSEEGMASLKKQFDTAKPYRHIAVDGLLHDDFAEVLLKNFPKKEDMRRHYEGLNEKKSEGSNFEVRCVMRLHRKSLLRFWKKLPALRACCCPMIFAGLACIKAPMAVFWIFMLILISIPC
jgi:hypothetical protein